MGPAGPSGDRLPDDDRGGDDQPDDDRAATTSTTAPATTVLPAPQNDFYTVAVGASGSGNIVANDSLGSPPGVLADLFDLDTDAFAADGSTFDVLDGLIPVAYATAAVTSDGSIVFTGVAEGLGVFGYNLGTAPGRARRPTRRRVHPGRRRTHHNHHGTDHDDNPRRHHDDIHERPTTTRRQRPRCRCHHRGHRKRLPPPGRSSGA